MSVPPRSAAGARIVDAVVGFTHASQPVRLDSVLRAVTDSIAIGLLVGAIKPPAMTQAERDKKYRDEAFEVIAARGAGVPVRRTMIGASIPVGLPFGGPSRKQRERDRAIFAQSLEIRALRQLRIDSIVAARKRRADSLAHVADSVRLEGARR